MLQVEALIISQWYAWNIWNTFMCFPHQAIRIVLYVHGFAGWGSADVQLIPEGHLEVSMVVFYTKEATKHEWI